MTHSLIELANLVQGQVIGDASTQVSSLSPIDGIIPGTLVFAEGNDNFKIAESSTAAALLVSNTITASSKPLILVSHPFKAFIQLLNYFNPPIKTHKGIHPSAIIEENVHLGENVSIGPFVHIQSGAWIGDNAVFKSHVHIGHQVKIGHDTYIHPNVTIYDHCEIGARVTIHASSVIGSDGFGYAFVEGKHLKIPHLGKVIIEDDVEIGANTAIDRATMGETVIGEGTKIDNLVQIAHSVKLGKHNILCAFTGIAGSSSTGNHVILAANVGVSDHVRIDDNAVLAARTGVSPKKHLNADTVYFGFPARPKDIAIRNELSINRIPLIRKNIKTLKEQIAELDRRLTQQEVEKA